MGNIKLSKEGAKTMKKREENNRACSPKSNSESKTSQRYVDGMIDRSRAEIPGN